MSRLSDEEILKISEKYGDPDLVEPDQKFISNREDRQVMKTLTLPRLRVNKMRNF